MALSGSKLTFGASSEITFAKNNAMFLGGAMSASNSELILQGRALFKGNVASQGGGAVNGHNSRIYCSGENVRFQDNHAKMGFGGAIYTQSSNVDLEKARFEGNVAKFGGAVGFKGTNLHISTCTFVKNPSLFYAGAVYIADSSVVFDKMNHFERNHAPIAGAVYLFRVNVTLSGENNFLNNSATIGSGCLVLTLSNATLRGTSTFHSNHGAYGGGIHGVLSNVTVSGNSSFMGNAVDSHGGGILFSSGTLSITGQVSFVNNGAVDFGSALFARFSSVTVSGNVSVSHGLSSKLQYSILEGAISFLKCRASFTGVLILTNNSANEGGGISIRDSEVYFVGRTEYLNNQAMSNGGALFARNSKVVLRNSNHSSTLKSNIAAREGGAIYAIDSSVYMTGTQYFMLNSAQRGGALALSGSSKLILTEPLQADFIQNNAFIHGGAIFIEDTFSISLCTRLSSNTAIEAKECFIELNSISNIQLYFNYNTAGSAGAVLYGGNLDNCRLYVGEGVRDSCGNRIGGNYISSSVDTFKKISIVDSIDNTTSDISSDPLQVCLCLGDGIECNDHKVQTVRGKEFTLQAVIVGQNKGIVPSSIRTSLTNDVRISETQHIQSTGKVCTQVTYRLFTGMNTTDLTLFPDGPCRDTDISRRKINVEFLPCPDGFTLDGSECICEDRLRQFTTNCSVDDNSVQRNLNMFWMGTVYSNETFEGLILHPGCPFDYCIHTPISITLDNLNVQCNHNRSGTLCGSCNDNYSIAFGTLHCLPCSNDYLALILPFALAGIMLVAVLLLLQISVASGTINGLIFYANVVQVNRSIFFPHGVTNILTVFIAWLNIDLGIESCFYDGMNVYVFTWLQFLFPFYVWFLIGLSIVMSRYSDKVARSLGKNPVAALATLLLLSYSKILRTAIVALSYARLEYPDGTIKVVWLYDGNVPYFQIADHLALGAFAIVVLLVLFLPYTLLLLCGHLLQSYSDRKILSWINKIKPFMDAYHAPYKKESRYWTGFLLVVRCILFLLFAFNALGNANVNLLAITSVTAGLAALAWIHNRVYEKLYNDILEASFILNLCIFAAATYHVKETRGSQAALAYTSVGIVFATFTCILLYHVYSCVHNTLIWKKLPKPNIKVMHILSHNKNNENETGKPDDRQLQDSETVHSPTTTTVELREPLLEM